MDEHPFDSVPDMPLSQRALLTQKTVHEDVHDVRICFSGEIDMSNSDPD